jgi:flagellar hook-basal body complex protein FliE
MAVTNEKHYAAAFTPAQGSQIAELEGKIGADMVVRASTKGNFSSGGVSFADAMLRAVDRVSASQNFAGELAEKAVTDPGSVDAHDVTIAQAKAEMELNIARTVLNRLTQSWQNVINSR